MRSVSASSSFAFVSFNNFHQSCSQPPFLFQSRRFARTRAAPPKSTLVLSAVDESMLADDLLMMGLKPLAAETAESSSSGSPSAVNQKEHQSSIGSSPNVTKPASSSPSSSFPSASYASKSSFSKFFQSSVDAAAAAKRKNTSNTTASSSSSSASVKLFQNLMSDLKSIKSETAPQSTTENDASDDRQQQQQQQQQQRKHDQKSIPQNRSVQSSKRYDPVYTDIMRELNFKSKHLEALAPDLERFQRNRSFLIRKWAKQDVADIVRRQTKGGVVVPTMTLQPTTNSSISEDKEATTSSRHHQNTNNNKEEIAVSDPSAKILDLLESESSANVVRDKVRNLIVSEVDPLEAKAREEAAFEFQQAVKERARLLFLQDRNDIIVEQGDTQQNSDQLTEQDYHEEAAFDLIEKMSDKELQVIFKSGALDLEALWEGSAELSQLPNEYLQNQNVFQLTRELADLAKPQIPNDDEAHAIVNADKDNREEFFKSHSKNLKTLEEYERRSSYSYVEQPNLVLQNLAQIDEKINNSLESMDRAKRLLLRDSEFQAALAYVQQMEEQEVREANVRPKMRKQAAELAVPFFDQGHSRPPKKALSILPEPSKKGAVKSEEKRISLASKLKAKSREMFKNRRDSVGEGDDGRRGDSSLNQWYD